MPLANPDLLGLARRSMHLGEIRIGTSVAASNGRKKPQRLTSFRFTTEIEQAALTVAELYGGQAAPWAARRGYFEVITDRSEIDVWVPPRGRAVDTNMEMWGGSPTKCLRWCDGVRERRSGKPCMCPMPRNPESPADVEEAAAERDRLAKLQPPQACLPVTRYNVTIPEIPGMTGVWKLTTKSKNAARESADSGDVLEAARSADVFLPAKLVIHWRQGWDGQPYPVPLLLPRQSLTEAAAMALPSGYQGMLKQLQPAGSDQLAITGGADAAEEPVDRTDTAARAQQIADTAARFTTREQVDALKDDPEVSEVLDEMIHAPGEAEETWEPLRDYLRAHWQALPGPEPARRNGNGRARRSQAGPVEAHAARAPAPPVDDDPDSLFNDPSWEAGR